MYETLRRLYLAGKLSDAKLDAAVGPFLTAEQAQQIRDDANPAPEPEAPAEPEGPQPVVAAYPGQTSEEVLASMGAATPAEPGADSPT